MLAQFDHKVLESFILWLSNKLEVNQAYKNVDSQFKYVDFDDIPTGYVGFQSEFRQIVADSTITGALTGITIGGTGVVANPASGVLFDYNNGRVILSDSYGTGAVITANLPVREMNIYKSTEDEEQSIMSYDFKEKNGRQFIYSNEDDLDNKIYALPACFVTLVDSDNQEHAFGGEELTRQRIRVSILSSDDYLLDGVMSMLRDSTREIIQLVPSEDFPFKFSFTLKSYPYSYNSLIASIDPAEKQCAWIDMVKPSKITKEKITSSLADTHKIGFVEMDIVTSRFPRV